MTKKRYRIAINKEHCKGCELCVSVCPKKVIALAPGMNSRGQHYAATVRPRDCIGCLQCAEICPDTAIEIDEESP